MNLDYAKIKEAAQNYQKDMTKFLREIVKNPGESCDEKAPGLISARRLIQIKILLYWLYSYAMPPLFTLNGYGYRSCPGYRLLLSPTA